VRVDTALGKGELTYGTEQARQQSTLRYLPNVSTWVPQEAPRQTAHNALIEGVAAKT